MIQPERHLAAIMFTDIVGYTALMGNDVEKGLEILRINRKIQKPLIKKYNGKWLKEMGDGTLAQFNTAIEAVRCAMEIQVQARNQLNAKIRIGLHLGDVIFENEDIFGDGVNIASRIQALADPGGIYVSQSIYDATRAIREVNCEFFGAVPLKNVAHLVNIYYLVADGLPEPSKSKKKSLIATAGRSAKRKFIGTLLFFLLIALATVTWWFSDTSKHPIQSIAVLPIENLSQSLDEDWLEAGIHHELIDALGTLRELRVVSRTTVLKYLNSNMTIPEIAQELHVDGVVEASLIKAGNNLRIQVRLIQAAPEERQLWNEEYNKSMGNVLSLYSDVARSIATEIGIPLNSGEKQRLSKAQVIDPKAYEAYLRGMSHSETLTTESLNKALDYFKQALDIEPDYALAYSGIAWVWGTFMQQGLIPRSIAWPKGKEAANKALALDSNLDEIHRLLAITYTWWEWDWEQAGEAYRKTLEINPNNSYALAYYSHYLAFMGRAEEGLTFSKKALEIDPLNVLLQGVQGMALKNARKYEDALDWLLGILEKTPNEPVALPALWAVYHELGMHEKALETAEKIYTARHDQEALDALEAGNREGGYVGAMRRIAETMIARRKTKHFPAWQIATLYTRAGMKNKSLIWLDSAYTEHDPNMPYISVDPLFDSLRDDPNFQELLRKMRLPELAFHK